MNLCKTLGNNIRKLRVARKLSQDELAHRAGVERGYLSRIENGQRNPSVMVLGQIAAGLNVKITALFAGYKND
jgi:transcriptional regulator with XRE-family HTH domain